MKKVLIGLTVLAVAFGAPHSGKVAAQGESGQTKKDSIIKGLVVCQDCYMKEKAGLPQEAFDPVLDDDPCGVICARDGRPLALVTEDGKMYTITGKLRERGDARTHNMNLLKANTPYPMLQAQLTHTVVLVGEVSEKNGQLEIAAHTLQWALDSKDWRVGSTLETKYSEGKLLKDGKEVK